MTPDRGTAAAQRATAAAQRVREVEARLSLLSTGRPTSLDDLAQARAAADQSAMWAMAAEQWFATTHTRVTHRNGWSRSVSPGASPEPARRVAGALARLARMQQGFADDLWDDVVGICARALGPCCEASLIVGPPQEPRLTARHGTLPRAGDEAQREAGEGPTADAWSRHVVVGATRLHEDPRWPDFTRLMQPSPIASVVAIPVLEDRQPVAVITGYTPRPEEFSQLDAPMLECLAGGVAALLRAPESTRLLAEIGQLREALTSRAVIDQAIGIVMAHGNCDADTAFQRLKAASRNRNIKLREIARMLVEHTKTGESSPV
ncbi:MAG: ANTAR domain-containing response regulator [Nocardioidaceae bacterium]